MEGFEHFSLCQHDFYMSLWQPCVSHSLHENFQVVTNKEFPVPTKQVFFPDIPPDWAPGLGLFFFSRVLLITVLSYSSEKTFLDWHNVYCDSTGCNLTPSADRISGATFLPPTGLSVNMEIKASARTKYTNLHFHITETSF